MNLTPGDLAREAREAGFRPDILEKVFHLIALLEALNTHPFLKQRMALKGGAALNLFLFETPRLSVDIDLNYLGSAGRDMMLAERPTVEQASWTASGRGHGEKGTGTSKSVRIRHGQRRTPGDG